MKNKIGNTVEEIIQNNLMGNISRKSKYIDNVETLDGIPMFTWVDINCTELCNRSCIFCPRNDPLNYPNQPLFMDLELAGKIASELKELKFKGGVIFSGYSEPLMHPEIAELINIFSDYHTELATNGDLLNIKLLKELKAANLSYLLISLYDNEEQVTKILNLLNKADYSQDMYLLRPRWYGINEEYGLKLTNRAGSVKTVTHKENLIRPCYYMHYSMQVDWNGDVMLCVQDFNKKIKFGNLNNHSMWEIWTSKEMCKKRRALGAGNRSAWPCNLCDVNGTMHGKKHHSVWKKLDKKA